MALNPKEELPPGSYTKLTEWKCLIKRLRTGVGRSKETLNRWGYLDNSQDVKCKCGTTPKQCTICLKGYSEIIAVTTASIFIKSEMFAFW